MNRDELTSQVKELAKRSGAMLCGVASIDRFDPLPPYYEKVPVGQHPTDFLPDAKSVISFAMPVLNPTIDAPARLKDIDLEMYPEIARSHWLDSLYYKVAHVNHDLMLFHIGQILGQFLLGFGYDTMTFPTEGVHFESAGGKMERDVMRGETKEWAAKHSPFRYVSGPISHRHCATRAGLGEFGYNNVVLTPQFGARQRFNTIVTDADLTPDPLITEPICLRDKCMLCLKACHMDAVRFRDDNSHTDYRSVEQVDRDIIFIDTPVKTITPLCNERKGDSDFYPIRGDCVRVCPVPRMPKHLSNRLKGIVQEWTDETGGMEQFGR